MKHMTQKTLASLMLSGLIAACAGNDSNPLKKYPNLQGTNPAPESEQNQKVAPTELFEIQVVGANEENPGLFIEGKASQTLIRVISKSTEVKSYFIEMTDFTSVDRPTLVDTKEPGVFALQWLPPVGTIPGGKPSIPFRATIKVTVTDASNGLLKNLSNSRDITVEVNRNSIQPIITGYSKIEKVGIDEGVDTKFTVDVQDDGGEGSPRLPEVMFSPYRCSNTEAYRANASQAIVLDEDPSIPENPKRITGVHGEKLFRFFYVINFDRLPFNRDRLGREIPAAPTVEVCFLMQAKSAVQILSGETQICTTARYAAQAPRLTFNDAELKAVKSGVENVITFKVNVDHPSSVLSIKKPTTQIAGLSGQKNLECSSTAAGKQNELTCVLTWTPTCQKADSTKSLTLKADTELGSKTKTTTEVKEITILAGADLCAKPKEGGK